MPPTTSEQSKKGIFSSKNLLLAAVILGIVIILTAAVHLYTKSRSSRQGPPNATYLSLKENPTYQEAVSALDAGNSIRALELFKSIEASDEKQYSFLQIEIANATVEVNRELGIQAYIGIADNPNINKLTKAYAVHYLGRLYMSTHDPMVIGMAKDAVNKLTTDSVLAANLKNATQTPDMLISLFEISSSYFPISEAEMMLAYLYATKTRDAGKENETAFNLYKNLSLSKIKSADMDKDNVAASENLRWFIPLILQRKAITLGILQELGVEEVKGEDPAKIFDQALNISYAQGAKLQPFILYTYAAYLYRIGGDQAKISSLLQPIVENKENEKLRGFFEFTRNAFKNQEPLNMEILTGLSKIYPPFGEIIK